ncbi:hypothetical protein SAY86_013477 [Trapa natans]|uniref:G-box binding protein multifunctional mosaic region domain-containing protein n=1 Tax=Trapa natans TaxID=22666 RepID=A0AAN7RFG4_TRANT|nr:hypothetical protein SAY86_013477 [Trapa natans]
MRNLSSSIYLIMGNNEESMPSKSQKPSTAAATDLTSVRVHPDWATMQAHYGPRVALPSFYPYMWGPVHPLMLPYGTPYTAVYPPGGIYGHPGVSFGSAPGCIENSAKLPGNADGSLMKKLKRSDSLAMAIGNEIADCAELKKSQRLETEGSSEGTSSGCDQGRNKRSPDGAICVDRKQETDPAHRRKMCTKVIHSSGTGTYVGPASQTLTPALELKNSSSSGANLLKVVPSEAWLQDKFHFYGHVLSLCAYNFIF